LSNYGNPPSDPYGQNPQDPAGPGSSPQNPYGESTQDPYAQAPQAGYGQNPYGDQGYGQSHAGQGANFAPYGKRVGAYVIDALISTLAFIPAIVGIIMFLSSVETTTDPVTGVVTSEPTGGTGPAIALIGLGTLLAIAFALWNTIFRQGKTGYSIGKGIMGIKLVKLDTGQPIGAGMAFVRYLVGQLIGSVTCGVGSLVDLLWPLWDDKNQTLHDKAVGSVVIDQPKS
jgi:uncharacterized RDD family membrane protein YckC